MKVCTRCDQLWYLDSGKHRRSFNKEFICDTCFNYINRKDGKCNLDYIPPLSKLNNVHLNEIPQSLKVLKNLELRLLAPRQAFLWLSKKPISNEAYTKGPLCLFPADTVKSQKVISQVTSGQSIPCDNPEILTLDLRRRVTDKKTVISETIRPQLLKEGALYLETISGRAGYLENCKKHL